MPVKMLWSCTPGILIK